MAKTEPVVFEEMHYNVETICYNMHFLKTFGRFIIQ